MYPFVHFMLCSLFFSSLKRTSDIQLAPLKHAAILPPKGICCHIHRVAFFVLDRDYCADETVELDCGHWDMIRIEDARYGRMSLGRCITNFYGNIGCSEDVTSKLRNRWVTACAERKLVKQTKTNNDKKVGLSLCRFQLFWQTKLLTAGFFTGRPEAMPGRIWHVPQCCSHLCCW